MWVSWSSSNLIWSRKPVNTVKIVTSLSLCWAGAVGLSFLQFCNLNSFRTKFVLGFSVFMGLSVAHYFNEYTAINGYGPVHTGSRWVCKDYFQSIINFERSARLVKSFFHSEKHFLMKMDASLITSIRLGQVVVQNGPSPILPILL